ncbi:MAG: hypothetical protein A3E01_09235 [Gammaproteobacteria bacterium RIFCSPHIGHO2_12_FULL_63_22]|nr:MAG: hypothetical protein A3E01_09235 [Gammaproteobacteria bacterium RIFCSPHIGHO2_12_FULL_63_22]
MAGVTGEISLSIKASLSGTADLGTPRAGIDTITQLLQISAGTAAVNQADLMFADQRTLAASATEDLDLAGVLTNAFGATITAAEIVAIYIEAASGNTNNVNVTRPASNGFVGPFLAAGDGIGVKPGEYALLVSQTGWAVTAGTGDLLTITNSSSGTGVTYDIVIIGRSVAA